MNIITGYLSGGHIRSASHLQRTYIAVESGGTVADHAAVVHGAGGVQHFVVWQMYTPRRRKSLREKVPPSRSLASRTEYVEQSNGQPASLGNGPFHKMSAASRFGFK